MKIKLTYIVSNINKALAFEWIAANLNKQICNVSFILLNPGDSYLESYLKQHQITVCRLTYRGKKDLLTSIAHIYTFLKKNNIDAVHCHLFDACIAGLLAAKLAGIKKRIFTRHHATFHQMYFPRAVWYDKLISAMATDIVAISENVKKTLIEEGVDAAKIHLIHHGFELKDFTASDQVKISSLQIKYNRHKAFPVIGVISRYFELKGIQYIIPAFQQLLSHYPNALLILANASGNYKNEICLLLKEIPEENYVEIPFEPDIFSLYQLFDVFVHTPIDPGVEAFGQTYVESLAAGIPSVFTLSGVAPEFINHKQNALVADFKDAGSIFQSMMYILKNPDFQTQMIVQGKKDIQALFKLKTMIQKLENLYSEQS